MNFTVLFEKSITRAMEELKLYPNEESLWILKGDVKNSAGTLALHLTGNLKHFIGATLGNTGYLRQRDKEFADRHVPRQELIKGLEEAMAITQKVLSSLSEEDLNKAFPLDSFGKGNKTIQVLVILLNHFEYHLGQINYHRRLLSTI